MSNEIKRNDEHGDFIVLENNKKSYPMVSIIMSAYDTPEKFLIKSIESILEQSFENFEFIIINDGANEKTSKVVNSYAEKDNRILVVVQKNMGLTKSLNRGIYLAKGKYIARQDTDDIWMKNKLEKQLAIIEQKKDIVLIGTQCQILNKEFENISESMPSYQEQLSVENTEEIRKALVKTNPFCHASVLIRKDVLESLGYYNDRYQYSQDYELWVRVLKEYEATIIPELLTKKVFHNESITGSHRRKKQRLLGIRIQYKAMQYFGSSNYNRFKLIFKYGIIYVLPERFIIFLKNKID